MKDCLQISWIVLPEEVMVPLHCVGGFYSRAETQREGSSELGLYDINRQNKEKFPVFIGIIYLGLSLVLDGLSNL